MSKEEDFYKGLKEQLENSKDLPGNYTYKFIIPNDNKRLAELQRIFDAHNPQFSSKTSKTGKYISLTVVIYAFDATQVINFYKEAASIEGVIML